jgi:zinc/manganese transport system permease protein
MLEIMEFLAAPLAATVLIALIHVYLGIHILRREVIFVDLALAQIAALGATVAFIINLPAEGTASFFFSLGFVVLGAALFAISRMKNQRVPQEAIIGIVYVVATAGSILVADRAAGGAEHIKEMLTGAVLWVRWETILHIALIYAAVAVFHRLFRHRFIGLTERYREGVFTAGDRWWDFLFYLTFGIVIVMSVRVAGILMVFSFLVVPTSIAFLVSSSFRTQMLLGWGVALVASVLGLALSYLLNTPCGPVIVVLLGLGLAFMAVVAGGKEVAAG